MQKTKPRSYPQALFVILAVAAFARLLMAIASPGFDHPNEIYRLLEPIAFMNGYLGRLPWEWKQGLLSPLPVKAQQLFLHFVARAQPLRDPESQALVLRIVYGLLSLTQVFAVYRLVAGKHGQGKTRSLALGAALFLALWPEFVYRSVRLMDYSLEASLLACALILALPARGTTEAANAAPGAPAPEEKEPTYPVLAGIALGLAFFVRFQSGLYFLGILAVLALTGKDRAARALRFSFSYVVTIVLLAFVEAGGMRGVFASLGPGTQPFFLSPFVRYVTFNVFQNGAAHAYGTQPWHRYFSEIAKMYGFAPLAGFAIAAGIRGPNGSDKRLLALFLGWFLVYTLIPHKESRFILGFAWLLVPVAFSGMRALQFNRALTASLVLVAAAGLADQVYHNWSRIPAHADDVHAFARMGARLQDVGEEEIPLVIEGDPDFLPGSFYLRYHGPVCYELAGKMQGECPPNPPEYLLMTREGKSPRILASKSRKLTEGAWTLAKIVPAR